MENAHSAFFAVVMHPKEAVRRQNLRIVSLIRTGCILFKAVAIER